MTDCPAWLPPKAEVEGVWEEVEARLYAIFHADFKQSKPRFEGRPVWWDRRILPGEKCEEGFWHLITREDSTAGCRIPDFPRAKRLPWCAPTISHPSDPMVKVWDYREGNGEVRTYVWLEDLDYVVVLQKQTKKIRREPVAIAFLVTAFHVDGESSRRRLARKHLQRIAH